MADPDNLLRPWVFDEMLRKTAEWSPDEETGGPVLPPCPTCGGRVRMDTDRRALVCNDCGLEAPVSAAVAPKV